MKSIKESLILGYKKRLLRNRRFSAVETVDLEMITSCGLQITMWTQDYAKISEAELANISAIFGSTVFYLQCLILRMAQV